jgi:hypothetical protein
VALDIKEYYNASWPLSENLFLAAVAVDEIPQTAIGVVFQLQAAF